MKIDNTNLSGASPERLEQNRATAVVRTGYERTGNANGAPVSGSHDQIDLSGLSKALSEASTESPSRVAQVEQLAKLYAEGSYHADAAATSRQIVEDALTP